MRSIQGAAASRRPPRPGKSWLSKAAAARRTGNPRGSTPGCQDTCPPACRSPVPPVTSPRQALRERSLPSAALRDQCQLDPALLSSSWQSHSSLRCAVSARRSMPPLVWRIFSRPAFTSSLTLQRGMRREYSGGQRGCGTGNWWSGASSAAPPSPLPAETEGWVGVGCRRARGDLPYRSDGQSPTPPHPTLLQPHWNSGRHSGNLQAVPYARNDVRANILTAAAQLPVLPVPIQLLYCRTHR